MGSEIATELLSKILNISTLYNLHVILKTSPYHPDERAISKGFGGYSHIFRFTAEKDGGEVVAEGVAYSMIGAVDDMLKVIISKMGTRRGL